MVAPVPINKSKCRVPHGKHSRCDDCRGWRDNVKAYMDGAPLVVPPKAPPVTSVGLSLSLPYPPSVNHYWRRDRGVFHISVEGKAYRKKVVAAVGATTPLDGPLSVRVVAHPPDRRRRDLDNTLKALLDSLAHAGVYGDDSQIDALHVERGEVVAGGRVAVTVAPWSQSLASREEGGGRA